MRLTKKYRDRWSRLFEFLHSLPTKKFDFNAWGYDKNTGDEVKPNFEVCTTVGCVAGWLPNVFPTTWIWDGEEPRLRSNMTTHSCIVGDFYSYFGIHIDIAYILLIPNNGNYAGDEWIEGISEKVTPKQWLKEAKKILEQADVEVI